MKRYIHAMSDNRSHICAKLDDNALDVIIHLIKYYSYPGHRDKENKWPQDIYADLNRIPTLKSSHKYPSADFIFKSMWEDTNYNRFNKAYNSVIKDYGNSPMNKEYVKEKVMDYLHWLSDVLSEDGFASDSEIKNYLRESE